MLHFFFLLYSPAHSISLFIAPHSPPHPHPPPPPTSQQQRKNQIEQRERDLEAQLLEVQRQVKRSQDMQEELVAQRKEMEEEKRSLEAEVLRQQDAADELQEVSFTFLLCSLRGEGVGRLLVLVRLGEGGGAWIYRE